MKQFSQEFKDSVIERIRNSETKRALPRVWKSALKRSIAGG